MATVTDFPTQDKDAILKALAADATEHFAGEASRINRGLVIAMNSGVALQADGSALVQSATNAEIVYEVANGSCDCPDASRATDGRCKHFWATTFVQRATAPPTQRTTVSQTIRQHPVVFYAHLDDQAGALCRVANVLYFVSDDGGQITVVEPAHINFLVVLGQMQTADAQRLEDLLNGGYTGVACSRAQEVA